MGEGENDFLLHIALRDDFWHKNKISKDWWGQIVFEKSYVKNAAFNTYGEKRKN